MVNKNRMQKLLLGLPLALALVAAAHEAKAEAPQCTAESAGQLLCRQATLCQCQYFTGGAVTGLPARYGWDCGALRPRCEADPKVGAETVRASGVPGRQEDTEDKDLLREWLGAMAGKVSARLEGSGRTPGDAVAASRFGSIGEGLSPVPGWADTPLADLEFIGDDWEDVAALPARDWPSIGDGLSPVPQGTARAWRGQEYQQEGAGIHGLIDFFLARPQQLVTKSSVPLLGHRFVQLAADSKERRIRLELEIEALRESLSAERQHSAALEAQRDDLIARNAALWRRLLDMRAAQQTVLNRVKEHTLLGIVTFEDTLSKAGLDVEALLSDELLGASAMGQGGPFIPGGILNEPEDPVGAVYASLAGLDLQIGRWERLQALLGSLPLAAPLAQFRVTSNFGPRVDPVNGKTSEHHGMDFVAALGAPVLSTAPGKVVIAGWKGRFGRLVEVDHGYGIRTRYAHLQKIEVKLGQYVYHRQTIGLLGNSGRSTGAHVHYEVLVKRQPRDPLKFLEAGMHLFKNSGRADIAAFEVMFP